jgi:hypothetical protein
MEIYGINEDIEVLINLEKILEDYDVLNFIEMIIKYGDGWKIRLFYNIYYARKNGINVNNIMKDVKKIIRDEETNNRYKLLEKDEINIEGGIFDQTFKYTYDGCKQALNYLLYLHSNQYPFCFTQKLKDIGCEDIVRTFSTSLLKYEYYDLYLRLIQYNIPCTYIPNILYDIKDFDVIKKFGIGVWRLLRLDKGALKYLLSLEDSFDITEKLVMINDFGLDVFFEDMKKRNMKVLEELFNGTNIYDKDFIDPIMFTPLIEESIYNIVWFIERDMNYVLGVDYFLSDGYTLRKENPFTRQKINKIYFITEDPNYLRKIKRIRQYINTIYPSVYNNNIKIMLNNIFKL